MGLPILVEKMNQAKLRNPTAAKLSGWYSVAHMMCLDEFLKLLALNLNALRQFKALVQGLIGTAGLAIAALQLAIAQLETTINTLKFFISTIKTAIEKAKSSLAPFAFGSNTFASCPPVQALKTRATGFFKSHFEVPGNAGKMAKKYKQATQSIKELEYRIYKSELEILKYKKAVDELQVFIIQMQAIVDAIGEQFGV